MTPPEAAVRHDPADQVGEGASAGADEARAYRDFWADVGSTFPDLHGARSTAQYLEDEQWLFQTHLAPLEGLRILKTDLWDEAKNTRILRWAAESGSCAFGVDISPGIVRSATRNFEELDLTLHGVLSDVRTLPFQSGSFDAVYSMGTVEHFADTDGAVREIFRVVRPGGRVVIGVPNRWDPFLRPLLVVLLYRLGLYGYGFEKSYSRRTFRRMLTRAGFKVTAETGILFIPGWLRMLDLACYTWARPLSRLTGLAVAPFHHLSRWLPWLRRYGYLPDNGGGAARGGGRTLATEGVMTTDPQTRPPDPPPSSGVLRFALTAGAWFVGLFGLMRLGWVERQILLPFAQLQERVADQLTGAPTDAVYVDASCSGGDAMALCLGAVLAFPATWSARLRGAGIGLLVIAAFNIVRIGNLSLVAAYPSLLDILHIYVWPAILILVAVAYVYAWMRRQMGPAVHGAGSDPVAAWHGPARRFLLLTAVWTAAYFAAAGWVYESALLRTLGVWVAMTSAGILAALGVSATASGNIVTTTHGAFIVTQECIATPLIPVYVAGALAVPLARWQRMAALGAAPAIFFLLGVARLLVLALPTTLVASHTVAIHAFSQVLVAGILVAGLAGLSARSAGHQHPARRAVGAIGVGIVAALAVGPLWSNLLHWAVDGGQLLVQHGGHRPVDDPQGAIAILPALQLGLCAAFWAAVGARGSWRRLVLGVVGLAGLQLTVLLGLGELSHHLGFAPHVSLIRAWGVVAPLAVVWVLRRPRLTVSPPAPVPVHPLPQPG